MTSAKDFHGYESILKHFKEKHAEILRKYNNRIFGPANKKAAIAHPFVPEIFNDRAYCFIYTFVELLTHHIEKIENPKVSIVSWSLRRKEAESFAYKCAKLLFSPVYASKTHKKPSINPLTLGMSANDILNHIIWDFYGARIVVKSHEDIENIKGLICGLKNFSLVANEKEHPCRIRVNKKRKAKPLSNCFDLSAKLDDNYRLNGYKALHFQFKLEAHPLGLDNCDKILNLRFELQIKTSLSNAWGDLTHDDIYKPTLPVSKYIQYRNSEIASILSAIENDTINNLFKIEDKLVKDVDDSTMLLDDWELHVNEGLTNFAEVPRKNVSVRELLNLHHDLSHLSSAEVINSLKDLPDGEKSTWRTYLLNSLLNKTISADELGVSSLTALSKSLTQQPYSERLKSNLDAFWEDYGIALEPDVRAGVKLPYFETADIAPGSVFIATHEDYNLDRAVLASIKDRDEALNLAKNLKSIMYSNLQASNLIKGTSIVSLTMREFDDSGLIEKIYCVPAEYNDQLATNIGLNKLKDKAEVIKKHLRSSRSALAPFICEKDDVASGKNFLVNSIGVSALICAKHRDRKALLFSHRSNFHWMMPNLVGPTFTWAMYWPSNMFDPDASLTEALKEQTRYFALQQLGIKLDLDNDSFVVEALSREIVRFGKPQFFCTISVDFEIDDILRSVQTVMPRNKLNRKWFYVIVDEFDKFLELLGKKESNTLSDEAIAHALLWRQRTGGK